MSERLKVMREIARWVHNYSWTTYYNQKNSDDYPIFHANTNSKPDLLLQKGNYNVLVEIKQGESHQDILNGIDQLWKYAGEYYTGRHIYLVDENLLTINAFVFATQYSRYGFLYAKESALNYLEYEYLKENYHMIEKPISHSIARFLWRQWEKGAISEQYEKLRIGKAKNDVKLPQKPRIGILIAKTEPQLRQIYDVPYLYLNSNYFVPMSYEEISCFGN